MTSSDQDLMVCEGETLKFGGEMMDQEIPEGEEEAKLLEEVKTNPSKFQIREYMNDIVIFGRDTKLGEGKFKLSNYFL